MVSCTQLRTRALAVLAVAITCSLAVLVARGRMPAAAAASGKTPVPDPAFDEPLASSAGTQSMIVAGGCFWGVQAVFQHVKGVVSATSGYAGGTAGTAQYDIVSSGRTGHAESVKVTYDPSRISYGQLLKIFFTVAHDPTQLNAQGPDVGPQYRSALFVRDEHQRRIATAYVEQLNAARIFSRPIATTVDAAQTFYEAEAYHQDYFTRHPHEPYILINDRPKVDALRRQFPELYVDHR
jgi:peptide-methionine (S)-S-oxide reductase